MNRISVLEASSGNGIEETKSINVEETKSTIDKRTNITNTFTTLFLVATILFACGVISHRGIICISR